VQDAAIASTEEAFEALAAKGARISSREVHVLAGVQSGISQHYADDAQAAGRLVPALWKHFQRPLSICLPAGARADRRWSQPAHSVIWLRHWGGSLLSSPRFPLANITGLDINPLNIAVCRSRLRRIKDSKLKFAVAGSTAGEASASYDAIFAMAVFRHGKLNVSPPPPKCDHFIHFADFERSVTDLARCLKPGGLLAIQHAMFRFADTRVATEFEPILSVFPPQSIQLYDRDDCNLPSTFYPDVMFRKLE